MDKKESKGARWVFLSLIIVILAFSILTSKLRPVESRTMEVEFSVGDTTGINVDTDKLYFGRIVRGGSAQRTVNIENGYIFPLRVKIFASKEIIDYIFLDNEFIVEPGKVTHVPITLNVPLDMPYGNYSGKIRFDLLKA